MAAQPLEDAARSGGLVEAAMGPMVARYRREEVVGSPVDGLVGLLGVEPRAGQVEIARPRRELVADDRLPDGRPDVVLPRCVLRRPSDGLRRHLWLVDGRHRLGVAWK